MRSKIKSERKVILFSLICFFLLISTSEAGLKERVFEKVLPNGLKVLLLENHKAPVATFQVWYRVGSRNEVWGKTGLSHMLEHMMFKGTNKVGPKEFSRIIQENGGNDNAFTSRDYTAYFANISADRLHVPIELESDRMVNLILREEDFKTERMVVMEERRLRTEDNPRALLMEQMGATAFQIQPYHWPIIGWMEDITRFTLEDLKAYYSTYYNPVNAMVIVVGDFRKEELLAQIEKAFGPYPKGAVPEQERNIDPPQHGERRIILKKEAQLPSLVMGYHIPNLRDPDSYVLEVIAALLSEGKSSRLYQNLVRDKRLVMQADADNSFLSRDPGLFYLSAAPLPGKDPAEVEKALQEEVERLQGAEVSDSELEKAKNQLEASFVFGQDSLFYQAMLLAQYEISHDWRAIDDYIPAIRRVSAQDIQRVAKRYLVPDNRTVAVLVPLPKKDGEKMPVGSSIKEHIGR